MIAGGQSPPVPQLPQHGSRFTGSDTFVLVERLSNDCAKDTTGESDSANLVWKRLIATEAVIGGGFEIVHCSAGNTFLDKDSLRILIEMVVTFLHTAESTIVSFFALRISRA
jgi:hypothetical protein